MKPEKVSLKSPSTLPGQSPSPERQKTRLTLPGRGTPPTMASYAPSATPPPPSPSKSDFGPLLVELTTAGASLGAAELTPRNHYRLWLIARQEGLTMPEILGRAVRYLTEPEQTIEAVPQEISEEDEVEEAERCARGAARFAQQAREEFTRDFGASI